MAAYYYYEALAAKEGLDRSKQVEFSWTYVQYTLSKTVMLKYLHSLNNISQRATLYGHRLTTAHISSYSRTRMQNGFIYGTKSLPSEFWNTSDGRPKQTRRQMLR